MTEGLEHKAPRPSRAPFSSLRRAISGAVLLSTVVTSCCCLALGSYGTIFLTSEALLQAALSLVPLAPKQATLLDQASIDDPVCVFRLSGLNGQRRCRLEAFLVSQSISPIPARGMSGRLSCRMVRWVFSKLFISKVLVRRPCARTPYVRSRMYAPLPTRQTQSLANCLRACVFDEVANLNLSSPLFNYLEDMIFTWTMC